MSRKDEDLQDVGGHVEDFLKRRMEAIRADAQCSRAEHFEEGHGLYSMLMAVVVIATTFVSTLEHVRLCWRLCWRLFARYM
mmetsp:Transcript_1732/g.3824  ORF Transcript_1732/g.3824 Transcript_1732/m.3824 type:complete len:81 (-) Transcript_1732:41-283(-)